MYQNDESEVQELRHAMEELASLVKQFLHRPTCPQCCRRPTLKKDTDNASNEVRMAFEEPLTPRQFDVLQHLPTGLTRVAIGREMGISKHTINEHLKEIYGKFGVNNRTEAINEGKRRGLLA